MADEIKKEEIKKEGAKNDETTNKEVQAKKSGKWKKIGLAVGGLALAVATSPLYLSTKVPVGIWGEVVKIEVPHTEGYVAPKCQWDDKKVCDIQNYYKITVLQEGTKGKPLYTIHVLPSENRPIEILKASIEEKSIPRSGSYDPDGNILDAPSNIPGSYILFDGHNCGWLSGVHLKNPIDHSLAIPADKIYVVTKKGERELLETKLGDTGYNPKAIIEEVAGLSQKILTCKTAFWNAK